MTCTHHWVLEPGVAAKGVCTGCGEEREFSGGIMDFSAGIVLSRSPVRKSSITHGISGYKRHKCRCDVCRAANTEYHRRYQARRSERETA